MLLFEEEEEEEEEEDRPICHTINYLIFSLFLYTRYVPHFVLLIVYFAVIFFHYSKVIWS